MFLDNPAHRGTWEDRLRGAWASHRLGEYMPVTWMSYAVDRSLWDNSRVGLPPHQPAPPRGDGAGGDGAGLPPPAPRARVGAGRPRTRSLWVGATVAALAFAVHPLRVEPVAWVSARGTVLGGLLPRPRGPRLRGRLGARGRGGADPAPWLAGSLVLFAAVAARAGHRARAAPGAGGAGRLSAPAGRRRAGPLARARRPRRVGREARLRAARSPDRADGVPGPRRGGRATSGASATSRAVALTWGVYSLGFYVLKTLLPGTLSPVYPMPEGQDLMIPAVLLSLAVVVAVTAGADRAPPAVAGADHGVGRVRSSDRAALGDPALRPAARRGRSLHVRRVHRVGHRGGRRGDHGVASVPERGPEARLGGRRRGRGPGHPRRLERAQLAANQDLAQRHHPLGMGRRGPPGLARRAEQPRVGLGPRGGVPARRDSRAPRGPGLAEQPDRASDARSDPRGPAALRGIGRDSSPGGGGRAPLAGGADRSRLRPLRVRRHGQAVEQLQRAIRLDPDEARAHDYLGRALMGGRTTPGGGGASPPRRRAGRRPWPPTEPLEPAKAGAAHAASSGGASGGRVPSLSASCPSPGDA